MFPTTEIASQIGGDDEVVVFSGFEAVKAGMDKLVVLLGLVTAAAVAAAAKVGEAPWRLHTLFSVECQDYFDWQTVGLVHSFKKAGQPGPITRLLSCTEEEKRSYKGMGLAPTFEVPSMSRHPRTGDW